MRRALIIVSLVALGAGGLLVGLSTSAGHTATAGVRPPAHPRPATRPHAITVTGSEAPTVPAAPNGGVSCFVGGTECSLTPCTEFIGSANAVAESGVFVPAPATPRPTADCSRRATPRGTVPSSETVTVHGPPAAAAAAQAALPGLQHTLARKVTLHP